MFPFKDSILLIRVTLKAVAFPKFNSASAIAVPTKNVFSVPLLTPTKDNVLLELISLTAGNELP